MKNLDEDKQRWTKACMLFLIKTSNVIYERVNLMLTNTTLMCT